jgi:hypothetical protein
MPIDIATVISVAKVLGVSADKLYGAATKVWKKREQDQLEARLAGRAQRIDELVQRGLHIEALATLYPDDAVVKAGLARYACSVDGRTIVTSIVNEPGLLDLEIDLDLDCSKEQCRLAPADPKERLQRLPFDAVAFILADIHARGLRVWDQPLYRLRALSVSNGVIEVEFGIERFATYRVGIGALDDELYQALVDTEGDLGRIAGEWKKYLPWRQQFLPNARSVAAYVDRLCVGGIHATVAIQRPAPWNDFVIPVQRRSRSLSEGHGLITPLPAAFHQPLIDPRAEMPFSCTVFREVFEELFGGDEAMRR